MTVPEGERVRRAVLGDARVDRSNAARTGFDRDFGEFITEYAWGGVWSRPGLDTHTRRLLTIAVLCSLGCEDELVMHVRAALADGVTADEVKRSSSTPRSTPVCPARTARSTSLADSSPSTTGALCAQSTPSTLRAPSTPTPTTSPNRAPLPASPPAPLPIRAPTRVPPSAAEAGAADHG
nr:hypothetical protein GCM10025732_08780 [Glycomyces mayteni]